MASHLDDLLSKCPKLRDVMTDELRAELRALLRQERRAVLDKLIQGMRRLEDMKAGAADCRELVQKLWKRPEDWWAE